LLQSRGVPAPLAGAITHEAEARIKEAASTLPQWAKILFALLGLIGTPGMYAIYTVIQTHSALPDRVVATEHAIDGINAKLDKLLGLAESAPPYRAPAPATLPRL